MKIDRRRPSHWFLLVAFGLNVALAWLLRRRRRRGTGRPCVVLYGHKLGGNLLAIQRRLREEGEVEVVFLTLDPQYYRTLRAAGEPACQASAPACVALLARADAVVSDHGLHAMSPLPGRCDLRFFDVWHGIPFKGFDADDFRVQHRYDEVWVASPRLRTLYVERFGFDPARVAATGYARTDALVHPRETRTALQHRFGLGDPVERRYVLFAPTWKQDARTRSLFPFGLDETRFVADLAAVCRARGATLLVRKHLNSGADTRVTGEAGVVYVPFERHPDTEALLQLADVLVCDWSSIAFDFLLLDRPTLFLGVEPPFAKGFSLGPEYRFGPVIEGFDALCAAVAHHLDERDAWRREHGARADAVRAELYGDCADGAAAARCTARLRAHLPPA